MKIILANYRYYVSGGPEVYMFNIKRLLEEAGHTVIPYSVRSPLNEETPYASYFPHGKSESGDAYFSNVKKTPKNIARLLSCAFYNREAYKNLRRLIQDERPDVVYVLQQINALSPSVFKACYDEGVRVVHRLSDFNIMCPRSDFLCEGEICTACMRGDYQKARACRCCHGSRATTEVRVASMRFHRARGYFDMVDAFVCPTGFTSNLLEESGIDRSRIHVIPTFVPKAEPASAAGSSAAPYALYLGRISPEKGVDLLVEAAAACSGIRLKVTGRADDEYARSVVARVQELGISNRVEFTGFVQGQEKRDLIAGAACVLVPSVWYENMPNAVLEAYSFGKPVVVFDVGCMTELVKDGETGLIVPFKDVGALGEAIKRLLSSTELSSAMGARARELALAEFSPKRHLESLLRVLSDNSNKESGLD